MGAGLIDRFLSSQCLCLGGIRICSHLAGALIDLAFLLLDPSFKLLGGLLFGQGPFFDTVQEVVVINHTLVLHDGARGVRHLCTHLKPVQRAVMHDVNGGGVGVGIVSSYFLNEAAVSLCAGIGGDNVVEGLSFLTVTLEAKSCCHVKNVLEGSETPLLILEMGGEDSAGSCEHQP